MLYYTKLDSNAIVPTCAYPGQDLGFDIFALEDTVLPYRKVTRVRTGIALQYAPWGDLDFSSKKKFGLLVRDRSSMSAKGITVSGGVIDSSYTGEVTIHLTSNENDYNIKAGDKIAQLIPMEVFTGCLIAGRYSDQELPNLGRGDKGFGSTGV